MAPMVLTPDAGSVVTWSVGSSAVSTRSPCSSRSRSESVAGVTVSSSELRRPRRLVGPAQDRDRLSMPKLRVIACADESSC